MSIENLNRGGEQMKEKPMIRECSTCSVFYELGKKSIDFRSNGLHFFISIPDCSLVNSRYISECPGHFGGWLIKIFQLYRRRGVIEHKNKVQSNMGVRVNWKKYNKFKRIFKHSESPKMNMDVLLLAIGVFSLNPVKSWQIVANSNSRFGKARKHDESLNPGEGLFYFRNFSDAKSYAKLRWPRSNGYLWELRKIEYVHTVNISECYRRK